MRPHAFRSFSSRRRRRRRSARPRCVEAFEARRLLSIGLVDGVVTVVGTDRPEEIHVYRERRADVGEIYVATLRDDSLRPTLQAEYPVDQVRMVIVRSGGGDDLVDLSTETSKFATAGFEAEAATVVPSRIDGGDGNDVLHGGMRRDFIRGGFGDNRIVAHDGSDWLDGGAGDDEVRGGNGNDLASGGDGNDALSGGPGSDRLSGGAGNDYVGDVGTGTGPAGVEPGFDIVLGGEGDDWLIGGAGRDRVLGGQGRDHFTNFDHPAETRDRAPDEPADVVANDGVSPVTFAFRGTFLRVVTQPGAPQVDWPAHETPLRGTITFNPAAPDSNPDPTLGDYTTPEGPVRVTIDGFRWEGSASRVLTADPYDRYEAGDAAPGLTLVSHPELAALLGPWHLRLLMWAGANLLNGPGLPLVPPSVDRAANPIIMLEGRSSQNASAEPDVRIEAALESLMLVPTPAPAP